MFGGLVPITQYVHGKYTEEPVQVIPSKSNQKERMLEAGRVEPSPKTIDIIVRERKQNGPEALSNFRAVVFSGF